MPFHEVPKEVDYSAQELEVLKSLEGKPRL